MSHAASNIETGASAHPLAGNATALKRVNRVRALARLRFGGPASRADLARATGLDAKTITNVCNDLLRERLVRRQEAVVSGRGRPAERLAVNPDAATAIGVDFGASQVSVLLADLSGATRRQFREDFDAPRGKAHLLRRAMTVVAEFLSAPEAEGRRPVGIGLSVPGLLDAEAGAVRYSVNIRGFRHVPIVSLFRERFGLPVALEEASRAMALAETWFAPEGRRRDFICVDLGFGIGMGVVHGGRLYRGANGMSGEIGHTIVRPGGRPCTCGKRGCLETVASGKALGELAARLPLKEMGIAATGARAVCEAARAGNAEARQALARAGEAIGTAIANVINLFDPERVILNGGLIKAGPLLVSAIRRTAADHVARPRNRTCPVEVSRLGESAAAMGAAMLPLRTFFEFDHIRL